MKYKNTLTGVVIDTPCKVSGENWVEVGKESKAEKIIEEPEKSDFDNPNNEVEETEEEPIDLSEMTVADLKKFAIENGIDIGKATRKDDIIQIIAASDAVEVE